MYATIDVLIHATEDQERILNSLTTILELKQFKLERRDLTGHYKNPLTFYRLRVKRGEADKLLKNIIAKIDRSDLEYVKMNLDEYIHKSKMYLRIDKNFLCRGMVRLAQTDPIKIVFHNIDRGRIQSLFEAMER